MRQTESDHNFNAPEFITRLKAQEHTAITLIVKTYTEHLYRTALGLGFNRLDAQEITQAVWVTFFDIIAKFKEKSHVRTFLFGILYNKASELRREQKKFQGIDIEDIVNDRFDTKGNWSKPPIDPEEFLLAAETQVIIEKCLDTLPLNQRMAFSLKEIEEKNTSEICHTLNISATNLGVLMFRAKNKLRECIEKKSKCEGDNLCCHVKKL